MTKTEIKQKAQLEIMYQLANTLTAWTEREGYCYTEAESEAIQKEIITQSNRIAKLMGYKEAWHN